MVGKVFLFRSYFHTPHPYFLSSSMTVTKPTIAIVGGGISGVVLAIALIRRGLNVNIYEQAHAFGEVHFDHPKPVQSRR